MLPSERVTKAPRHAELFSRVLEVLTMNLLKQAATAAAVTLILGGGVQAATLDDIKSAGELKCLSLIHI